MKSRSIRRRCAAELVGTFVIVVAPVSLAAIARHNGVGSLLEAALVSGFAVMGMVYALGPISAAHFNPAVTLAFACARRFPWRFVTHYWLAQLLGSVLAGGLAFVLFGPGGAHIPADPSSMLRNVATEALLAFILMLVIISVATDKRVSNTVPGLSIGLTVVLCVLIGGPVTGGSMNPARSFGPALFNAGALDHCWLYIVGPCIGAVIGAVVYEAVRLEPDHSKGAPNELLEALTGLSEPG